jgi:predicted phosphodiesterase
MKILVIPDTHGDSSQWIKKNLSIYDQIVFMGDYFDSKTISFSRQMNAFEKILFAKDTFKEKVVLLIGNHELH